MNVQRSTQPHLPKTSSRSEELSHSFDSPDLIPANFLLFHKGENPKRRRCQDVKDIKKNLKTELDTVSLSTFGSCFVQLLEIHIVKEDDFHEKIKQFSSYFTCVSALVDLILNFVWPHTSPLLIHYKHMSLWTNSHTHTHTHTHYGYHTFITRKEDMTHTPTITEWIY